MPIDPPLASDAIPNSGRGRPRDIDVDDKIMSAARSILAQDGFEAMSFKAIAALAGVTRPTIYRRWPTKAHLANEIANGSGKEVPDIVAEQGLEQQIRAFVILLLEQYSSPETAKASIGLIVSYQNAQDLRDELHTPLEDRTRARLTSIIDKGKALGLVRPDVDADTLFDVAVGAVMFRSMFSSLSVPPDAATSISQILLNGIAAREGRSSGT
ncbi:TetR/AcrR family transcriptional regulator [Sphingobium sp. WCS2017Hpa-17]|uniref:TetR/AcrR family transcriptional regulator n=1 Tax=Sphingobium sp. WCS2017Hpa-17 TaxID=3073638 RepID=UPI002889198E|nr:TetR/AcrR family transcriptional regulator [Sphingobium sp. WCS2017Hpa-17]